MELKYLRIFYRGKALIGQGLVRKQCLRFFKKLTLYIELNESGFDQRGSTYMLRSNIKIKRLLSLKG